LRSARLGEYLGERLSAEHALAPPLEVGHVSRLEAGDGSRRQLAEAGASRVASVRSRIVPAVAARDASADARPERKRLALPLARPRWLLRIERAMRPLDHLPRSAALGAGAAAGAAAGLVLGWSGEPWTLAVGATLLAGAGWLVASAEPIAVVERTAPAKPPPLPSEALEMIDLPGGWFWMGSAENDRRADDDEHPQHEVEVSAFSIAKHVVTQKLYQEVMGENPSNPKGEDLPANNVNWHGAIEFCNRLSDQEGLARAYLTGEGFFVRRVPGADGYRLPTEAEWEYACRAGTKTAYSFGDDEAMRDDFAWFAGNATDVQPVGLKKPNPWGLHDMNGNVWDWCWDLYESYPYKGPSATIPAGGDRVLRGGSFVGPRFLRSAVRDRNRPLGRSRDIGLRCVRGPRPQPRSVDS
jgi:sulfatase modifying factor 1